MKKILSLAIFMAQAVFCLADNTLEVASFIALPGAGMEGAELAYDDTYMTRINMYNEAEDQFAGLEFYINVPKGVLVDFEAGSRSYVSKKKQVHQPMLGEGTYTSPYEGYDQYFVSVIDNSFNNYNFIGESGDDVLNMYYGIPADMALGEYKIYLTDVKLIKEDAVTCVDIPEIVSTFTVGSTVGIANVETLNSKNVYDLQGRRTNAKSGVLLVNGQKQIVK